MKLPDAPDPANLIITPDDLRLVGSTVLWRLHRTSGDHVVPWNELRYWGPSALGRFDPHEPPPRDQPRGVSYTALDVPTALAEAFQNRRFVNINRATPYLTAWVPDRSLRLLDLTGYWPIRSGGAATLSSGRRDRSRSWARAIHSAGPDLDGLWHRSSMTGAEMVTLFTHAADSFPDTPAFSAPLNHPGLRSMLLVAAKLIGYRI
ncbi:MAG: RES domain-containing protein [Acidimicrobiales bacterium]